ncbi:FHA domain-containing protein [Leptolyngbya sp. BC1307]|uniref:FHA domain-containing protein n=1 Tax=Leptolyngbya sp. BC1307 TaxID=2029589 RepID=UPI000EFA69A9|nr:FHA domain-containing protein [Leptolyngbya sp. BC1307]
MLKTKVINYNNNDVYEAEIAPRSAQQAECLIGRHPNCDLVLEGPAVSRVHGRVLFESGQCFFTDLGSTDGSRLNNEEARVNQAYEIVPDDVIRIGEFALIVEALTPLQSAIAPQTWSGEITARCVQIIQETCDVKTFRFVAEPEQLFDFKPGQFVTLKLPIESAKSAFVMRSYSISSSPSRPHTLDITVKRVAAASPDLPPGIASNWLHGNLIVGQTLQVQGPFGQFNCVDHPADKLLLISAGSGITPMMSIAQWLSDRAANTDITFIHAARTPHDIIFRQRLELLAAQHPHFNLAFTLTKNTPAVPWSGYRGRLNLALLTAICPDFAERTAFTCGPAGFMSSTKALLTAAGFPMANYFEESFGGLKSSPSPVLSFPVLPFPVLSFPVSPSPVSPSTTDEPSVEFSASGKAIACDSADTLLDAAEQAGLSLTSGCRMGSCGVCKQQLAAGEVCYDVEPRGLSEGDRATGQVLACVAKPVGRVVLAL